MVYKVSMAIFLFSFALSGIFAPILIVAYVAAGVAGIALLANA